MILTQEREADAKIRLYENGQITMTFARCREISDDHKEKIRQNGKVKKKYYIDNSRYRVITSSAVNLFRNKRYNVIFVTLTFPGRITHENGNKCFSKFIDNLNNNYNLNGYVAVHEFTHAGNSHYHLLCDLPYIPIININRAWNFAFSDFFSGSSNSVRLPTGRNRSVVKNLERCIKYVCKYFAKGKKYYERELRYYDARCSFISHNIVSRPRLIDREIFEKLCEKFEIIVKDYEYCKVFYVQKVLKDYDEFFEIVNKYP